MARLRPLRYRRDRNIVAAFARNVYVLAWRILARCGSTIRRALGGRVSAAGLADSRTAAAG